VDSKNQYHWITLGWFSLSCKPVSDLGNLCRQQSSDHLSQEQVDCRFLSRCINIQQRSSQEQLYPAHSPFVFYLQPFCILLIIRPISRIMRGSAIFTGESNSGPNCCVFTSIPTLATALGISAINVGFHFGIWLLHAIGGDPTFELIDGSTIWLHIALTHDYAVEFPSFLVFHPSTLLHPRDALG
jgi:hypothetical protein